MSSWVLNRKGGLQYCRHFLADNGVFHVERCMSVMQSGTQMVKLKGGSKGLVRLFYLDEHRTCIRWRPSRKNEKAKITIDSICKVLEGSLHRHAEGSSDSSCCFSVYHGSHMEALDLVTSNCEDARTWITGLKYLMAGIKDEDSLVKRQRIHDQWMKQTFEEADRNGDGLLCIEEIYQLMHKLNVNLPRRKIRQMFQEADTDENQGTLNLEEFSVFYKMMSLRRDLFLLVKFYSDRKDYLTVEELAQFLKLEQKMTDVTLEYCMDIIRKFEVSEENKQQNVLGVEGFTNFMRSPACDIFNPFHYEVNQDMDHPLCNYFIASSHNTYLTGDQLLSQSKVDMYSWVLQAGCRCVEVDCWDGPEGEPIVQHGYTLTSKVLFRDVVETINKYAFIKNEYPVILSIENHCSIQQQQKIAQYLKDILGDKLNLSPVDAHDTDQFPTPQSLKGKILIKGKKLPPDLRTDAEEGEVSDEDSADEIEEECKLKQINGNSTNYHQVECFIRKKLDFLLKESQIQDKEDPDSYTVSALLRATHKGLNVSLLQKLEVKENVKESGKKAHNRSFISSFSKHKKSGKSKTKLYAASDEDQQDSTGKETGQAHRMGHRRKTVKLYRGLSDLVIYTNSVTSQDLLGKGPAGKVLSLSETQANQLLHQKPEYFNRFNQKQLTRIYPSAYRIDSSNFNPQEYWNVGCQMVALNYQSDGRMLQLNRALFMLNGNCGYVLKPQSMCQDVFNPFSEDPLHGHPKKQLTLKIISGQQLPKPPRSMLGDRGEIIDPFVEVEIIGLPIDCCKEQTRVVDDNGFNPVWEETVTFTVHMPEIALVRFLVWDHDPIGRDFVGQRTVPFSTLMPGYRHVYLEDMEEASLFVHVMIHDIYGKMQQLMGLKGLFNKNSKNASVNRNRGNFTQKKSFGNRILRRTASAPTKGSKKSKSVNLEMCTELRQKESNPLDCSRQETQSKCGTRKLQTRPASMPVDKLFYGEMLPPVDERPDSSGTKANKSSSKKCCEDKSMESSFVLPQCIPLTAANEFCGPRSQDLTRNISKILSVNTEDFSYNVSIDEHSSFENLPFKGQHHANSDEVCDKEHFHENEQFQFEGNLILSQLTKENLVQEQKLTERQQESLCNTKLGEGEEKIEKMEFNNKAHYIAMSSICSPAPVDNFDASQSLGLTPDSTVSHLIDAMSLSSESGVGSSISALIAQFETTADRTNLTMVSSFQGTSNHTLSMMSGLSQTCGLEMNAPVDPLFRNIKTKKPCLDVTADTTVFSSPETSDHSTYTIIHEEALSSVSLRNTKNASTFDRTLEVTLNQTLNPLDSPTNSFVNSHASSIYDTTWSSMGDHGKCDSTTATGTVADDTILNVALPIDSVGSSLIEMDEFEYTVTATENCNEDMSPENPPLAWNDYLSSHVNVENVSNCVFLQGLPASTPHEKALYTSKTNNWNPPHSAACRISPNIHPFTAANQPSACKSKSLGDLTSEDIGCTFESKYKFISKGFIVPRIKDQQTSSFKNVPQPADALTEQLRKLVSLEQEENQVIQVSGLRPESGYQRGLVRKLSSRSQSRVRYVANRAKQIQEANKHKFSSGVVLRNKPPVQHHTVNRHSTGSYIAGYLNQLEEEELDGRGIPEGSCSTLHHRYLDNFYTDNSILQTEPSTISEPEIYFLLRL
ncbi:1-phosphatidylinositol 4,5-bisphosphate phosphodiesterase eta-1 isoform X2 [Scyliorhinus canicula]|uniref:1-phosphatidylinositol 4,5-bisphosphate phosphodiesterase eta-1 isoform X2 n=1 Tax=Scyliorhinus canicula TaxID=7830 RepID=UPI0018F734B1|nr:1-phosphatidylinositol 4,5-bisphosphate phosphodiesterase eta-1 isoform X2 [Scyliorhinus canicula]